jgi:hypothetical protein
MPSAAFAALSGSLVQEVADATDEPRRRKLIEQSQARLLPNSSAASRQLGLSTTGYSAVLG